MITQRSIAYHMKVNIYEKIERRGGRMRLYKQMYATCAVDCTEK